MKSNTLPQKVFWLVMVVFGAIFYTTFFANHYYFRSFALDYGNYNFAFWDYSHFRIDTNPIYNVFGIQKTFLQDHFSLMLMYLVPVYWLLNWLTGSYTLMLIEVTMILMSAWALHGLIKLKTNDSWLAVIAVVYYFFLQGHYSAFSCDCNIYILAFCLVPVFLLCFELRKYMAVFILLLLFLFAREDMPLYAAFIFIILLIWHWREKKLRIYCLSGIILSLLCFLLIFKVFIPMLTTPEAHYNLFQYSILGNTPFDALMHCIKHPFDTFKMLFLNPTSDSTDNYIKEEFYLVYGISGGFVLFFRPQYFIWFIPIIGQKMFNDYSIRWSITAYYCDGIVTLLPISVFLIIAVLKKPWMRYSLSALVCLLALSVTCYEMNGRNRMYWDDTTKENMFAHDFFHANFDVTKIYKDLKQIPSNAKVCASSSILPHLSERRYIYEFPDVEDADYIAIFTFHNYYMVDEKTYSKAMAKYVLNPSWKMIAYDPPFLLMKKAAITK